MESRQVLVAPFRKKISIPPSKSYANRLLVLAALKAEEVLLKNMPLANDVQEFLHCLQEMGLPLEVNREEQSVRVKGSFPACENQQAGVVTLHSGEGGTTNRFLLPFLALGNLSYEVIPQARLLKRPHREILDQLTSLKVKASQQAHSFLIQGPVDSASGEVQVDCSQSTQFYSGMKMALGIARPMIRVTPINTHSSFDYIRLTDHLTALFQDNAISEFTVPLDFSSLSYPLALAVHLGEVCIDNYEGIDPYQADSALIGLLQKIGARLEFREERKELWVKFSPSLIPFEQDIAGCPDLFPTLCYLAAFIPGTSLLKNCEVLAYKESDRLSECLQVLQFFSIDHEWNSVESSLRIHGRKREDLLRSMPANSQVLQVAFDHRIVMMGYLFLRTLGGGKLMPAEAVEKSFPHFFAVMEESEEILDE